MTKDKRLDPFTDDMRASLVRELVAFWSDHPQRRHLSAEVIRQMAQEAAAFARALAGDVADLHRQMAAAAPPMLHLTDSDLGLMHTARCDQPECPVCKARPTR